MSVGVDGGRAAPEQQPSASGRNPRALLGHARSLRASIAHGLDAPNLRRRAAWLAFEAARDDVVRRQMATMPLGRLRETTEGRLRLGPVEAAGYTTVGSAIAAGQSRLERLPGVGPHTASQAIAAARQLEAAMMQHVRIRFDPDGRPLLHTKLLGALLTYEVAERAISPLQSEMVQLGTMLDGILNDAGRASSRLKMLFSGKRKRAGTRTALAQLEAVIQFTEAAGREARLRKALEALGRPWSNPNELWEDYKKRAVAYNGLLIEIGELAPDRAAVEGFIPGEVASRVHQHALDTSLLDVSLRGYQAFGAKFALAQRKAILGDEMGLGKTIEALAAMSHLHGEDERHFLVVCPASVLVNWAHEVEQHSKLRPYRLHGLERSQNLQMWVRRGGVALTTYDSLRSLRVPNGVRISMLVADEAHYVKNPSAARTQAIRQWASRTDRTLFLTGTPMENKVEEFRTLVDHLQPDVASRIKAVDGLAGATAFRQAVASVYLRRNQSDVLEELPPRIETEEWVELRNGDLAAYREAVATGNFMAMRRAAYAPGHATDSAKLNRLVDIVHESASNGRKIVVFSFFREVLQTVHSVLGDLAMGPLTGSVTPADRQGLVDKFAALPRPAVLVSQISAGGVGMNMQAASVVILTEPQWKPTIEDQAIGRCHRMGQVRPVDVHRLLAESSVDQRMLEILNKKTVLFNEYVRRSDLKDITPDAIDVSDVRTAHEVVSQAEAERRIVEIERRRLGVADDGHAS